MEKPQKTLQLVESLFEHFGMKASDHLQSDNPGRAVFGLQRGSAKIYVIVSYDGEGSWVQVISPILSLPAEEKRAACFEHLLSLNARRLINCAFGIEDGKIVLSSDRSAENLQFDELYDMLMCVSAFADDLDDQISEEFGCEVLGASD